MDPTVSMTERELLSTLVGPVSAQKILAAYQDVSSLADVSFGELSRTIGEKKALKVRASIQMVDAMESKKFLPIDSPESLVHRFMHEFKSWDYPGLFLANLDENCRCKFIDYEDDLHLDGLFENLKLSDVTMTTLMICHMGADGEPTPIEMFFFDMFLKKSREFGIAVMDIIVVYEDWKFFSCRQRQHGHLEWESTAPDYRSKP